MRLREMACERGIQILSLLIAALFWRPLTSGTFFFRDLYLLSYPKRLLLVRAIHEHVLPLWDPFTNGGQPYLATPENYALHPSNLLYLILPPLTAFNWVLVLHVWFCGVAAYWLARTLRLPQAAAFVTGAVFALCGFTLSEINLTVTLLALPWVPVAIGLTHRSLRDGRSIAPAAIAAALPLYCGAAELTAVLFVTLIVWVAFAPVAAHPVRRASAAAFVIVFAIALASLALMPAASVIAQSSRGVRRSYRGFSTWSVSPQRLVEMVVPRFFGPTTTLDDRDYWGRPLESEGFPNILSIYFGIPVILLAVAGVRRSEEGEFPHRALAIVAGAAIALSLGRWLPGFRAIYDYVPLVTRFRYPVKALMAAILPISLLAGSGVASMTTAWRRIAVALAAIAGTLALLVVASRSFTEALARALSFDAPSRPLLAGSFAHAAMAAAALAIALSLTRHRHVAIAAVVAADLAIAGYEVNVYAPRSLFDEPPIARTVRSATGEGRFHAVGRETILRAPTNEIRWLARWEIATLGGYTAAAFDIPVTLHVDYAGLAPRRIAALSSIVDRLSWPRRLNVLTLAGVSCFSTTDVVSLPGVAEIAQIQTPKSPIRFYANSAATPARFVSRVIAVPDESAAAKRFVLAADPASVILRHAGASQTDCGTAPVAVVTRGLNHAAYEVDAPCAGYVVFAETDYDGWSATVDRRPTPIVNADFAFTAVPVSRGRHTIERRYTQPHLVAGAVASLVALVLLFPAVALLRQRPKQPTS